MKYTVKYYGEPWKVDRTPNGVYITGDPIHQLGSTFGTVCDFYCRNDTPEQFFRFPNDEANAARAVACVNSLQGIDDPAAFIREVREAIEDALAHMPHHRCRCCGNCDGECAIPSESARARLATLLARIPKEAPDARNASRYREAIETVRRSIARAVAEGSLVSAKWIDDTLRKALETP